MFARILLVFPLLQVALSSPYPRPTWTTLADIALLPRQEHTTFFLRPSTIGIIGGVVPRNESFATTDLVQLYSIPDNSWKTVAPMPIPLNHVNAAVVDGKLYVLGGLADTVDGNWAAIPDSWVYDPVTDIWQELERMPAHEARGSAAVGVYGCKIYLAGGMRLLELREGGAQDTADEISIYDTVLGTWVDVPQPAKLLPEGRDHAGVAVVGHRMYVLGGRNSGQENVKDTVFILDLEDLESGWTTSDARLPTARGGLASGTIDSKVYTFGGEGNLEMPSGVFNETEVYDTVTDSWKSLGPMRLPRHGGSAVGVGNKVYFPGGGVRISGSPVSDFDVFKP